MVVIIITIFTFAALLPVSIIKWHIVLFTLLGVFVNPGILLGFLLRLMLSRNEIWR